MKTSRSVRAIWVTIVLVAGCGSGSAADSNAPIAAEAVATTAPVLEESDSTTERSGAAPTPEAALEPTEAPQPTPTPLVDRAAQDPDAGDPDLTATDSRESDVIDDPAPEQSDAPDQEPIESDPTQTSADPGAGNYQRLTPRWDLTSTRFADIESVGVSPDGMTLFVRFWGGVEPCFGANVQFSESPNGVQVGLVTGLPPEAAVSTCIALAVAWEIEVPLDAPLGSRQVTILPGEQPEPPPDGPPADAVFLTDQYLGLTLEEAEQLAAIEGRALRVRRVDDEQFAGTMDLIESRVNIEIENGIVVAASGG